MPTGDLRQRYHGVYLATVVDTDDPEGLGRVRIECDQVGDSVDTPLWASVARPLAGSGATVHFTPRVGDQLVIAYLAGDPHEPIVMGSVHHTSRRADDVGARRHAIVTDVGRVTLDEERSEIVIDYRGSPASRVTMSSRGVEIEVGPNRVEVGPAMVAIDAPMTVVRQGTLIAPAVQTGAISAAGAGAGGAPPSGPEPPLSSLSSAKLRARHLEIEAESISIVGAEVCINGQAVVLRSFVTDVYAVHTHGTGIPPEPSTRPGITTECGGG